MRRQQARRAAQAVLLAAISALASCGPGAIPAPGNVHTALAHAAAIRANLDQTGYGDEVGTKATFDGVLTQNGFAGTEDDNGDAGRVLETGGVIYISGRLLTRHLPTAPATSWGKLVPAATPLLAARS